MMLLLKIYDFSLVVVVVIVVVVCFCIIGRQNAMIVVSILALHHHKQSIDLLIRDSGYLTTRKS